MQAMLKDQWLHQPRTQDCLTFEFLLNICESYISTWEYLSITSKHCCNCQSPSNCAFIVMVSLQKKNHYSRLEILTKYLRVLVKHLGALVNHTRMLGNH